MKIINIAGRAVGPGYPCFIIAEIGINHNGDLNVAKKLIDAAAEAGADAVKFQTRTVEVVYTPEELAKARAVPRSVLENGIRRGVLPPSAVGRLTESNFEASTNGDLKRILEFTVDEYHEISRHCKLRGVIWLTSCWDTQALERMLPFNLPCHKIASACNEDDALLIAARQTDKPVILSTGMTDLDGVSAAANFLDLEKLIILHCTSVYPKGTEHGDELLSMVNLNGIETLARIFDVPIGFSSHFSGIMPVYAAVAMGACMIEVHVTLERGMYGSDQASSLEPAEFGRLFKATKELHTAKGNGRIVIYPGEEEVAKKLRRVRRKQKSDASPA
jgi:N-acetylneuraminate synthase